MKKIIVVIVLVSFIISLSACAAVPVKDDAVDKAAPQKSARQLKFEQDEEARSAFIKGVSTFAGVVAGGLVGLLTSKKSSAVSSSITGCIAGGLLGFGLGIVLFDNTKPTEPKPNDRKVKEYFQEYRNIQLKE